MKPPGRVPLDSKAAMTRDGQGACPSSQCRMAAMDRVEDHYRNFLAPSYSWMSGGFESKLAENVQFFASILGKPITHTTALDLGCGSGFQSAALLSLGFDVVAVDSSEILIAELRERTADPKLTTLIADFRHASMYAESGPFQVAVCMGDTLVHLATLEEVLQVLRDVFAALIPQGWLVLGFRDLTQELKGIDRAIPVRLDEHQLMSTFLEFEPEHVVVNDMMFVQQDGRWTMSKSCYRKLRLAPAVVIEHLERIGFHSIELKSERGFCTIVARR